MFPTCLTGLSADYWRGTHRIRRSHASGAAWDQGLVAYRPGVWVTPCQCRPHKPRPPVAGKLIPRHTSLPIRADQISHTSSRDNHLSLLQQHRWHALPCLLLVRTPDRSLRSHHVTLNVLHRLPCLSRRPIVTRGWGSGLHGHHPPGFPIRHGWPCDLQSLGIL